MGVPAGSAACGRKEGSRPWVVALMATCRYSRQNSVPRLQMNGRTFLGMAKETREALTVERYFQTRRGVTELVLCLLYSTIQMFELVQGNQEKLTGQQLIRTSRN